jgi:hypothetical protein
MYYTLSSRLTQNLILPDKLKIFNLGVMLMPCCMAQDLKVWYLQYSITGLGKKQFCKKVAKFKGGPPPKPIKTSVALFISAPCMHCYRSGVPVVIIDIMK